ncbi:hypothetical protein [Spirosoma aerophilum]
MESIFVDSPPIEVDDNKLREIDAVISSATQRYIAVQGKTKELLDRGEDRLLSGSPGTVYLKKLGHRALSTDDFENLIQALGTQEDKQALIDFAQAQLDLQERLKSTKVIGLVLEQAGITRDLLYKRAKRPDLWKPEEVVKIMEVLDRLRV